MPIYRRCTKCKAATPESELGKSGVCASCMEFYIADNPAPESPEDKAPEEQHDDEPVVIMTRGDDTKEFPGHTEAGEFLGVNRQKVQAAIRFGKEIDGWSIA